MSETMKENTLQDMALEQRRAYYRQYRKRNADKVREWNSRYWKRKAERQLKENDHDKSRA